MQQTPDQTTVEHPEQTLMLSESAMGDWWSKHKLETNANDSSWKKLWPSFCEVRNAEQRMLWEKGLRKLVDGDIANYAFVDRIGKGIGIFYFTFEPAQIWSNGEMFILKKRHSKFSGHCWHKFGALDFLLFPSFLIYSFPILLNSNVTPTIYSTVHFFRTT